MITQKFSFAPDFFKWALLLQMFAFGDGSFSTRSFLTTF